MMVAFPGKWKILSIPWGGHFEWEWLQLRTTFEIKGLFRCGNIKAHEQSAKL